MKKIFVLIPVAVFTIVLMLSTGVNFARAEEKMMSKDATMNKNEMMKEDMTDKGTMMDKGDMMKEDMTDKGTTMDKGDMMKEDMTDKGMTMDKGDMKKKDMMMDKEKNMKEEMMK